MKSWISGCKLRTPALSVSDFTPKVFLTWIAQPGLKILMVSTQKLSLLFNCFFKHWKAKCPVYQLLPPREVLQQFTENYSLGAKQLFKPQRYAPPSKAPSTFQFLIKSCSFDFTNVLRTFSMLFSINNRDSRWKSTKNLRKLINISSRFSRNKGKRWTIRGWSKKPEKVFMLLLKKKAFRFVLLNAPGTGKYF